MVTSTELSESLLSCDISAISHKTSCITVVVRDTKQSGIPVKALRVLQLLHNGDTLAPLFVTYLCVQTNVYIESFRA